MLHLLGDLFKENITEDKKIKKSPAPDQSRTTTSLLRSVGPTTVLQRLPKACDLLQQVADCVKTLGLPLPVDTNGYGVEGSEPISLITDADLDHLFPTSSRAPEAGVVSWSPPTQNWNPWSGCNIDEGPLASASMDDISQVTRLPWALLAFFSFYQV